ncbi:uncharacterized protein LOC127003242 [Eriocheir sinensis]|uniref:uncharacterized protein LOC127003242 n=1 Tax=Eriocheir sinensis TaxID=95602 RepID=UPI0021C90C70|nr:uncharacterized protein LOC127003242 [Eriocheir sinensis]
MILHRVVVAVVVAAAVAGPVAASPQRARQSPFTMGMRFLENIRQGMTSTIRDLFGSSQGREVARPPPRAPNLDAAPPVVHKPEPQKQPIHVQSHAARPSHLPSPPSHISSAPAPHFPAGSTFSSNGPPSSFFKVVHEREESTPFPDTHGFSDESFHPNAFLPGPPPFQGNVEEDQLVSVVHDHPRPLPLDHNDLSQEPFPPHKTATSFASFGNTASFNLGGSLKRNKPDGHAPLHPRSILKTPLPQSDGPHPPPSLRVDAEAEPSDHLTVVSHSHSRHATHAPATQAAAPPLQRQRRQHHVAKKASATLSVQGGVGHFDSKKVHGSRAARDAAAVSASPSSEVVLLL